MQTGDGVVKHISCIHRHARTHIHTSAHTKKALDTTAAGVSCFFSVDCAHREREREREFRLSVQNCLL